MAVKGTIGDGSLAASRLGTDKEIRGDFIDYECWQYISPIQKNAV